MIHISFWKPKYDPGNSGIIIWLQPNPKKAQEIVAAGGNPKNALIGVLHYNPQTEEYTIIQVFKFCPNPHASYVDIAVSTVSGPAKDVDRDMIPVNVSKEHVAKIMEIWRMQEAKRQGDGFDISF